MFLFEHLKAPSSPKGYYTKRKGGGYSQEEVATGMGEGGTLKPPAAEPQLQPSNRGGSPRRA